MIKSDKARERVPSRFRDKRPDRTRPSTPEPELQTDPRQPQAPQVGATPQLIQEEYSMPEGYVHTPGSYQAQRVWRDNDSPDAFEVAQTECHADALRANRGSDGIPLAMEYVGYTWQLTRDGNGVLYNTIYANYAPVGTVEAPVDAPILDQSAKNWKSRSDVSGDNQSPADRKKRESEEQAGHAAQQESDSQQDGMNRRPFDPSRPPGPDNQPDQPNTPTRAL